MRAFIQSKNGEPCNPNIFNAYYGLKDMGFECIMFSSYQDLVDHHHHRDEIIVGGIGMIRRRLKDFDIDPPMIDYPDELDIYLGRVIYRSTLSYISNHPEKWPVFIKSQEQKRISGRIVRGARDLMGIGSQKEDINLYCSNVLPFMSEYRVFVRYGQVIGCKHYWGDPIKFPDPIIIKQAIEDYKSAPNAYGIDFGILRDGKTVMIEVNDAWALGCYGLEAHLYAKFLLTRWAEITETIDEWFYI